MSPFRLVTPFTADQLQWRQFFQEFTWLDLARGGTYLHPDAIRPRTLEVALVDDFYSVLCGSELPQSSWARSTRRSYQGWVTAYCDFCHGIRVRPLPVAPDSFLQWLDVLVTKLAGRTVTVAISAIVAWSALNNLAHPIDTNPVLRQAWRGLVRTRSVRVGPQSSRSRKCSSSPCSKTFGATTTSCLALTSSCCVRWRVCSRASSPGPEFGKLVCGPFATSGRSQTFRRSCDS